MNSDDVVVERAPSIVSEMSSSDAGQQGGGVPGPQSVADGPPSGFRSDFLASLDGRTAVVYRGEPTASELALLRWRKTKAERRAFAATISRVVDELREADEASLRAMLKEINGAAKRTPARTSDKVCTTDTSGSSDQIRPSTR